MRRRLAWHLDTRILRMLVAVAEAPSAAHAAARLNISPSALSHQMRKAEADLRIALFDRRGHRAHLTPVGEQLYASAGKILAGLEEAESLLERCRRGDRAAVRLGGGAYPVQRLLIGQLPPGDLAQLNLVARTRASPLAQAVIEGELDLVLVGSRVTQRGLSTVRLFEDELVAVVPAGHYLAEASCLRGQAYGGETYVSYSRVIEEGLEDELLFRPTRTAPARFLLAESVEAILDMVAAGLGFSILSRWSIPEALPGLRAIPLVEGGAWIQWSLVHRDSERDLDVLALRDRISEALQSGLGGMPSATTAA